MIGFCGFLPLIHHFISRADLLRYEVDFDKGYQLDTNEFILLKEDKYEKNGTQRF